MVIGISSRVLMYGSAGAVSEMVLGDMVVTYPRGNSTRVVR